MNYPHPFSPAGAFFFGFPKKSDLEAAQGIMLRTLFPLYYLSLPEPPVTNRASFASLKKGDTHSTITEMTWLRVFAFSLASGDANPLHFNPTFAASTHFKERIVHGMLTASFASAIFGCELPGPGAAFLEQSMKYLLPVKVGDQVLTEVTVVDLEPKRHRVHFSYVCTVQEKTVLTGTAVLYVKD